MSLFPAYDKEFATYAAAYREAGLPLRGIQGGTFADIFRPDYDLSIPSYLNNFKDVLGSLSIHNYPTSNCKFFTPSPKASMKAKKYLAYE